MHLQALIVEKNILRELKQARRESAAKRRWDFVAKIDAEINTQGFRIAALQRILKRNLT